MTDDTPAPDEPESDFGYDGFHADPVEGRPGGWVEGLGWVASEADLDDHDIISYYADETRVDQGVRADDDLASLCLVLRWADGTVPAPPPVPEPGDERATLDAVRSVLNYCYGKSGSEGEPAASAYDEIGHMLIVALAGPARPAPAVPGEGGVRRWCEIEGPHCRHPSEWGGDVCPGAS